MSNKIYFLLLFIIGIFIQSCSDDNFGGNNSQLQPLDFSIYLKYNPSTEDSGIFPKNANVTLINLETQDTYTSTSDNSGKALFSQITPGTYKATASKQMNEEEFIQTFGYTSASDEINFNGEQTNIIVNANTTSTTVEMKAGATGDLVIKQIYYGGSHISLGASFRDQFVEIHNNSNEVIYADGLCFAQLFGNYTNQVYSYTLANGQLDWSQSEGMTLGNAANTNYVYASHVYKIPGAGTQYPIQPGGSIVIAATAINHKTSYTDNNGKAVSILNPELTIDLSTADFEAYLGTYLGSVYRYDIQNPAVPDLDILFWAKNQDMVLDNQGRQAYIIFRASESEFNSWKSYKSPKEDNYIYLQIPNSVIIDGVDTTKDLGSGLVPKKLATEIDGGNTYLPSGAYTTKSVIRKTKNVVNGRIILQDTNNSSNDFIEITANPRGFAN